MLYSNITFFFTKLSNHYRGNLKNTCKKFQKRGRGGRGLGVDQSSTFSKVDKKGQKTNENLGATPNYSVLE